MAQCHFRIKIFETSCTIFFLNYYFCNEKLMRIWSSLSGRAVRVCMLYHALVCFKEITKPYKLDYDGSLKMYDLCVWNDWQQMSFLVIMEIMVFRSLFFFFYQQGNAKTCSCN